MEKFRYNAVSALVSSHVGVARYGRFSFWPFRCTSWFRCLHICWPRTSRLCRFLLSLQTRWLWGASSCLCTSWIFLHSVYMLGSTAGTWTAVSSGLLFSFLRCLRNTGISGLAEGARRESGVVAPSCTRDGAHRPYSAKSLRLMWPSWLASSGVRTTWHRFCVLRPHTVLCSFTNQVLAQLDLVRFWEESTEKN